MKLSLTILLALFGIVPMALAATSATATTPEFRLSLKEDAIRESAGEETLRYSPIWDGGSNEDRAPSETATWMTEFMIYCFQT